MTNEGAFFDSGSEDTGSMFDPLPKGTYKVMVDDIERKDTKAGDGWYFSAQFDVMDDKFQGRKLFTMFNIENPSEKAQEIGRTQFSRFLKAAGVPVLKTEEDVLKLVGCSMYCKVKIYHNDYSDEDENAITKFVSTDEHINGKGRTQNASPSAQNSGGGSDLGKQPASVSGSMAGIPEEDVPF